MKSILHIGTHKTGSTYLQKTFSRNRGLLLENGFDYTEFGRNTRDPRIGHDHRYLSAYLRGRVGDYPSNFKPEFFRESIFGNAGFLVSSENFYHLDPILHFKNLKKIFGSEFKVLVFFREPSSHIVSLWKEHIKSGHSGSLNSFICGQIAALQLNASYYNYQHRVEGWSKVAPVELVKHEASQGSSKIVKTFFNVLGIESIADKIQYLPNRQNVSYDDQHIGLLLRLNKYMQSRQLGDRLLITPKVNAKREVLKAFSRGVEAGYWHEYASMMPKTIACDGTYVEQFLTLFAKYNPTFGDLFSSDSAFKCPHLPSATLEVQDDFITKEILRLMISRNLLPELAQDLLTRNNVCQ